MKKFLKWGAIGLGVIVGVIWLSLQDLETQRWIALAVVLVWGFHSVHSAIEKARLDTAQRLQNLEYLLNQISAKQQASIYEDVQRDIPRQL